MKCEIPLLLKFSSREPVLNQNPSENDFTYGMVSVKTFIPLGRIVFLYWFKLSKISIIIQKNVFKYRELVSGSQDKQD